jgi:hypothetical protein
MLVHFTDSILKEYFSPNVELISEKMSSQAALSALVSPGEAIKHL